MNSGSIFSIFFVFRLFFLLYQSILSNDTMKRILNTGTYIPFTMKGKPKGMRSIVMNTYQVRSQTSPLYNFVRKTKNRLFS